MVMYTVLEIPFYDQRCKTKVSLPPNLQRHVDVRFMKEAN